MIPRLSVLAAILCFANAAPPARSASIADFIDFSLRNSSGQVLLPGRLFVPPESISSPNERRPLLMFLHGSGASGTDNLSQVAATPDYMLDEAKRRGAFLYVPQTSSNWTTASVLNNVMTMIDAASAQRPVDARRLYLTGYSLGGGGAWSLLSRYAGRFAAAMPVAGVAPASGFLATNLVGTPLWAVHSRDDASVAVATTRNIISGILTAAHDPAPTFLPLGSTSDIVLQNLRLDLIYYEPAAAGHVGVQGIYYAPTAYDWMFAHALAVPEPPAVMLLLAALPWFRRKARGEHAGCPSATDIETRQAPVNDCNRSCVG